MKTDVSHIADNTGFSYQRIDAIKHFLFLDEHDLGREVPARFDSGFEIAQSWQRLIEGKNIQPHDITLLHHEELEMRLMNEGMTQAQAHTIASKQFDYPTEVREFYGKSQKHRAEG